VAGGHSSVRSNTPARRSWNCSRTSRGVPASATVSSMRSETASVMAPQSPALKPARMASASCSNPCKAMIGA
jgi:hypothetical protein